MKTWTRTTALLSLLLILTPLAHGSTVTITPTVIIKTQYGQLTTVNTQTYQNFTVYANATIAFYVPPAPVYTFTAKSYGNGTMQVKFFGPQPLQVNTKTTAAYTAPRLLVSYSTTLTETLVVIYSQAIIISNNYSNASLLWISFFGLILISAYLFPHLNLLQGTKSRFNNQGQEERRIYTTEEYEKEVKQRTRIVILFLVVATIASAFAAYFLTVR